MVLAGVPKELNIPYFAIGSAHSRESGWSFAKNEDRFSQLVGGNAFRWIADRRLTDEIRLLCTRNYVSPKTAFYADWLLFKDAATASDFLAKFPLFGTPSRISSLETQRQALQDDLDGRLQRGGFDIGKLAPNQRRGAADRFIKLDDKIKALSKQIRLLQKADEFRKAWTETIRKELIAGVSETRNASERRFYPRIFR